MPIFSLPGEHGIGDFGKCCWDMVDLSKKAGFSIWQILPLNPVGYGNSPYAPYSSFAGDEIYINLDGLFAEGLIQKKAAPFALERIDYQKVRAYKQPYFDEAYKTFFHLIEQYNHIDELTPEIVRTFIERIEVGEKILPDGYKVASHSIPFRQDVKITYRFIGTIGKDERAFNQDDLPSKIA